MSSRSLCKRFAAGNWHQRDFCEVLRVLEVFPNNASPFSTAAQLPCLAHTPNMKHLQHLRSGQQVLSTGQVAPGTSGSRSTLFRPTQRAFGVSSLRSPLRSAAVVTTGPTINETQKQPLTNDILLQSASSSRFGQLHDAAQPSSSTSASFQASITGTIQRITYLSEDTGYTVAKMKVSSAEGFSMPAGKGRPGLVTVTGKFPDMAVGQQWKCLGSWTKHKSYGPQLISESAEEMRPASSNNLIAYLCGGATKGVGPVTAANMVEAYGGAVLDILDSDDAVAKLKKVKGIGAKTAAKIKDEWEKRRGESV